MIRLAVRVQPNARTNEVTGWAADAHGGEVLRVRLRAPAIEGKANAALIEFLATILDLRPRQIMLERGDKSRDKIVLVDGLTRDEIRARIAPGSR
jgi:uncharacterized protein